MARAHGGGQGGQGVLSAAAPPRRVPRGPADARAMRGGHLCAVERGRRARGQSEQTSDRTSEMRVR